ncbi:MAG: SDR family NAD(P)-dependent oxidoreductase [Candidatus Kapabacteria bacterium]|jgi:short-subunit dehydrogenase|nr:SDR family NAD(P)-dependent oxidoreductase [Candidatus Kapabacteria bacterium]
MSTTKNVIIVGASTGIGRALALDFARAGFAVGITARREDLLKELALEINTQGGTAFVQPMDIAQTQDSVRLFEELLERMNGADIVVLNAAIGENSNSLEWEREERTIAVNVTGFTALATAAMHHFLNRRKGHLVGVSSIAGERGNRIAPAYAASKAYMSNYLQGLRNYAVKNDAHITITDIKPGFVKTPMTAKNDRMFWAASAEKAARQIFMAIHQKRDHVYITKRWRIMALLLRHVPDWLYNRVV